MDKDNQVKNLLVHDTSISNKQSGDHPGSLMILLIFNGLCSELEILQKETAFGNMQKISATEH